MKERRLGQYTGKDLLTGTLMVVAWSAGFIDGGTLGQAVGGSGSFECFRQPISCFPEVRQDFVVGSIAFLATLLSFSSATLPAVINTLRDRRIAKLVSTNN